MLKIGRGEETLTGGEADGEKVRASLAIARVSVSTVSAVRMS